MNFVDGKIKLREYIDKYVSVVTRNPLLANELEVALKWASYVVAGRFSQSPVVTELIHSVSKLLSLLNDNILRKAAGIPININASVEKLQLYLTVIEYSEVFAEVAITRIKGSRGKWITVVLFHLVKLALRLTLLLKYSQGLNHSPPISPLNRRKDLNKLQSSVVSEAAPPNVEVTFTLKTSGRVMRALESSPPLVTRSWTLPKTDEQNYNISNTHPTNLKGKYLTAEIMHLCRPLVHLTSMGVFGEFSWKPFLIAMAMDITSLRMLKQKQGFNKSEKQELSRRVFCLLLYLLRSPFYDQYSKERILSMLEGISSHVIGSRLLLRPLIEYIPEWQQQYFYSWTS